MNFCFSERRVGAVAERERGCKIPRFVLKSGSSFVGKKKDVFSAQRGSVMDQRGTTAERLSGWAPCKPRRTVPSAAPATDHPSVVRLRTFAGTVKVALLLVVVMSFKRESCGYALKVAARPTAAAATACAAGSGRAITSTPSSAYVNLPFCRRRCFYCDFPIKVRETAVVVVCWIAWVYMQARLCVQHESRCVVSR